MPSMKKKLEALNKKNGGRLPAETKKEKVTVLPKGQIGSAKALAMRQRDNGNTRTYLEAAFDNAFSYAKSKGRVKKR